MKLNVTFRDCQPADLGEVHALNQGAPRNDESLVFHERFGFEEVGQQNTSGGSKRVSLLVKELDVSGGTR